LLSCSRGSVTFHDGGIEDRDASEKWIPFPASAKLS
jgi:hypothetical protein